MAFTEGEGQPRAVLRFQRCVHLPRAERQCHITHNILYTLTASAGPTILGRHTDVHHPTSSKAHSQRIPNRRPDLLPRPRRSSITRLLRRPATME